jgi:hypothetical protein
VLLLYVHAIKPAIPESRRNVRLCIQGRRGCDIRLPHGVETHQQFVRRIVCASGKIPAVDIIYVPVTAIIDAVGRRLDPATSFHSVTNRGRRGS